MKTLEELIKELGLKPIYSEQVYGRDGNFVYIYKDKKYFTCTKPHKNMGFNKFHGRVIEVKPE